MPSNHLILCHSLLLLPSIFYSIRVFSNELTVPIRWPKYWSFNFSISPSNECSGLISFRINWFDLLAVQGTLKSLHLQSSKASILWHLDFFKVQLSHPYMTTGKTLALTIWTFVRKSNGFGVYLEAISTLPKPLHPPNRLWGSRSHLTPPPTPNGRCASWSSRTSCWRPSYSSTRTASAARATSSPCSMATSRR